MSGRSIAILMSLATLSSAAFALTITQSELVSSNRSYPTRADFDRAFGEFVTASTVDTEGIVADREKLRRAGLERLNFQQP
jgi:2-methylisocitrate lyase-like PEP mutase family enzyme